VATAAWIGRKFERIIDDLRGSGRKCKRTSGAPRIAPFDDRSGRVSAPSSGSGTLPDASGVYSRLEDEVVETARPLPEGAMEWLVYLSGEIHTAWRDEIREAAERRALPVTFVSPVTDHGASDDIGVEALGEEEQPFWKDHKGAKINAIRTRTMIERADVVVVRFGDKYRQWNAAFDAGYAAALGKPLITLHSEEHTHALKEVDSAALAVASTPAQIVEILAYVIAKE
jgi:YtoQ family protein